MGKEDREEKTIKCEGLDEEKLENKKERTENE